MKVPSLQEFASWLDEQEQVARQNYAESVAAQQIARADMFASQARCLDIARDELQAFLAQAKP